MQKDKVYLKSWFAKGKYEAEKRRLKFVTLGEKIEVLKKEHIVLLL